jgi:RHS repeat-associated protein
MTVFGQPTVNYSYDNANRLLQITQGSSIVSFSYDAAGRRTSLTLPNNVLVEYAYDAASRITSITYKQNGTTVLGDLTYEYDPNGNRTKIGGSFARTGIPQEVSSTAYNAANHQTTFGDKTLTYDNNGNLTAIVDANGTTLYAWNARNQLVGISGPTVNATFTYDGLGRREKKTINGSLTEFLFDGPNPVQETSGATVLANILPGLGMDEFLTRTDSTAAISTYFLTDALGSPIAATDAAGAVQTDYTYEPFGRTTVAGAVNSSSYQYTGRENDGTGLYYYRARYYHPMLQRFLSEDPLACEQKKGQNLYAYVNNNPMKFTDPSGLVPRGGGTRDTCKYYDDRCKEGSKSGNRDDYACKAGDCCRSFSENPYDRCVRQCLISSDEDCSSMSEPARRRCRVTYHFVCYFQCLKIPFELMDPQSCKDVPLF